MMSARRKLTLVLAVLVGLPFSLPGNGRGEERAQADRELRFDEIRKQFPHTDLKPIRGPALDKVLPRSDTVKHIAADVIQFSKDKTDFWLAKKDLSSKHFQEFYDFVAYSVPVESDAELDIVAYLKIETSNGEAYTGLILDTGSGPIIYALRKENRDVNWFNFATTRSRADVVGFLESLDREAHPPK